jgi:hypothetical protein
MCLPAAGMIFGLLGSAVSAMGAMAQADGQAKQAEYNAKVAEINARTARQQGSSEADKVEDKYQRLRAGQRVAAAKAGLDPSAGSAALVINQETTRNSELDQLTSIWNRETEAVGFENKAKDLRIQAQNAKTAGKFGAASSFLSGLGGALKGGGGVGSTIGIA